MTIWIDPPRWPAHGTLWSHVISDRSVHELHDFADRAGLSPHGFDADHYDVPSERVPTLIALGACATSTRDLLLRLTESGLRVPKRKRERVLATEPVDLPEGPGRCELIASTVAVSAPLAYLVIRAGTEMLITEDGSLPTVAVEAPTGAVAFGEGNLGKAPQVGTPRPLGYERLRRLRAGRGRPVRSWSGAVARVPVVVSGADWLPLPCARQRWGEESWWQLVGRLGD